MTDDERLERALEALRTGRSPRSSLPGLDAEEQRMVRFAQLLRGTRAEDPDPAFVESLHERLFPAPRKVSRRAAFLGGLGALAAGIVGGLGLNRLTSKGGPATRAPLVGTNGRWVGVSTVADLPRGTVRAFRAGHVQGFLVNQSGEIRALSRICTHMGCQLDFARDEGAFVCPCHGAEFTLAGQSRYGPGGYDVPLPPLPRIDVRQRDGVVEVWSV